MLHALFRLRFTLGSLPPYFWVRLIEIDNLLYNRVMALNTYQNFVSIYPTLRYWNANNCSQFWYLWGHLPCSAELRTLFIITRACAGPFLVDTISMELSIVYCSVHRYSFLNYGVFLTVKACFNLNKQCRTWWNAAECCISSGSSLFAEVPV